LLEIIIGRSCTLNFEQTNNMINLWIFNKNHKKIINHKFRKNQIAIGLCKT